MSSAVLYSEPPIPCRSGAAERKHRVDLNPEQATGSVAARAEEIYQQQRVDLARHVDRSFGALMLFQWLACVAAALWFSPKTWEGSASGTHLHVWTAWLVGGAVTCLPVIMIASRPGEVLTRHVVAVGQMLMSALLIHVTGGRIETHFHIFGSLAFLAFYRDSKVLITASVIVSLDHFIRGSYWPESAFGVVAASPWRWLEHTAWVVFEDVFLILSIRQNRQILREMAQRRAEVEEAKEAAERANRAKDDFLAVLSHELRTPLTPALASLSAMVHDADVSMEVREELRMIQRNVGMEAHLIDDLLDLSRIASGKVQMSEGSVDVHSILTHILDTSRAELLKKRLTIGHALDAKMPWVRGDSARLQQVFWNLLKNAMKFTPAGGCIVVRTTDLGERFRVDVTDTGIGITGAVIDTLFRPFQQGGAAVTRQFGGLGLGLSICRGIIELHDGEIRVQSAGEGKGATFSVELPVHVPSVEPVEEPGEFFPEFSKQAQRILLVDDHADTRNTLSRLLSRAGYDVTTADCVSSALQKAMEKEFDLLISDIGLPDGTGRDLMNELNTRFSLPGIAFSGFGMEGDVRQSLDAGFSAHLTKPVDFQQLKNEMARALARAGRVASSMLDREPEARAPLR
ncbi:MAG: response regulator [Verrucomicrobiaceae bacterium]|nr:MAG: response regulator [Verrucomicrobiaceae bacterium]